MGAAVAALWRYPVKSAGGERLDTAVVEPGDADGLGAGLHGDRLWGCIDVADGTVGSAKHPRLWGDLLGVRARTDDASGDVVLNVGGQDVTAGSAAADSALSGLLGRPVRMSRTVPAGARLHRLVPDEPGMAPQWMGAAAGTELVTDIAGSRPGGRFVDFGAVHLVSTGALDRLAGELDTADAAGVSAQRFRPNIVIDAASDPAVGERLHIGEVVLRVIMPTPRCIVPSLPQVGIEADHDVLRALAASRRVDVPGGGRAACFGGYAEVIQGGAITVGQAVTTD